MSTTTKTRYQSPCGWIELSIRDGRLTQVRLCPPGGRSTWRMSHGSVPREAAQFVRALRRYFAGEDIRLPTGALDLCGASAFQARVYRELTKVRFGQVVTYGELATRVGSPAGARAVGQAVAANPLPVLVPCHRVLAADWRLGGFSAGLPWKAALLAHEGWAAQARRAPGYGTRIRLSACQENRP